MTEFEMAGVQYRIGKLDAFKQFHVSRKIAPLIPTLVPVFVKLSQSGKLTDDLSSLSEVLQPFADGIAAMSDNDAEYVLGTCLSVVRRKSGDTWAPIWHSDKSVCMFDDIDMGGMISIAVRVIQESLGPFIAGMLTNRDTPATTAA